jgi:hypothetical protein
MMTAPGGMLSCARNSARYLEAVWLALHGKYKDVQVMNSEFSPLDNSLGLLIWSDQPVDQNQLKIIVQNSKHDTVAGSVKAFSYGGTLTNLVTLVYQFDDNGEIEEGKYHASIGRNNSGANLFNISFDINHNSQGIQEPQKPVSRFRTMGTGLFLFILCLGLAGAFWGLSGLHPFIWTSRKQNMAIPLWSRILQRGLQGIGITLLGFGLYVLFTRGWLVVLNV